MVLLSIRADAADDLSRWSVNPVFYLGRWGNRVDHLLPPKLYALPALTCTVPSLFTTMYIHDACHQKTARTHLERTSLFIHF
jgi:hypothetical protein